MHARSSDAMQAGDGAVAAAVRQAAIADEISPRGFYEIVCRDKNGRVKWRDTVKNLVTNAGEDYMLSIGLAGGTQIATWYLGLTDASPTVAETDVANSHAGWAESTAYTEANRVTWSPGAVSGQSVSNSSTADFSINATATIGGVFLISVNTKGGTTGTLYAVGAFTGGNKAVSNGDTLSVTATYTAGGA